MGCFGHDEFDYVSLPEQKELFSLPDVLFGCIEKRSLTPFGWRWRKRTAVLNPSGHLIIYKYFLEGIGAGKPYLGRVIHLDAAEHIHARMDNDVCRIKIHRHGRGKTELRVKGTKARLWAAKVFMYEARLNDCGPRSTSMEIDWPVEKRSLKTLDSRISTSSIYDVTTKENHANRFSKVTIASVSSESLPDYTTSDISNQNGQQTTQILGLKRIRVSEVITAREVDSKASAIEVISLQNDSTIRGRSADENLETNSLVKRSQSASDFTATTIEYFTAKEATRSLSLDHLDSVLASRRDRFRKHLQSLIDSGLYETLTECSLKYSFTNIQQLRAHAGNLRMSQINIPLQSKNGVLLQQQTALRSGPSSPLSTDINCKISEVKTQ